MQRIAVVLGATGGIGGAVARRLVDGGWTVRALVRSQSLARVPAGVTAIAGNAMDAAAIAAAATGAKLIVHAVNPPGYRDWDTLVLPMLDNTIAAARMQRATVLLPGTVYNYGPDSFPLIDEAAPQHPQTRKGEIRVEMEDRLRRAAALAIFARSSSGQGIFSGPAGQTTGSARHWSGPAPVRQSSAIPVNRASAINGHTCPMLPKPWPAWQPGMDWMTSRCSIWTAIGMQPARR